MAGIMICTGDRGLAAKSPGGHPAMRGAGRFGLGPGKLLCAGQRQGEWSQISDGIDGGMGREKMRRSSCSFLLIYHKYNTYIHVYPDIQFRVWKWLRFLTRLHTLVVFNRARVLTLDFCCVVKIETCHGRYRGLPTPVVDYHTCQVYRDARAFKEWTQMDHDESENWTPSTYAWQWPSVINFHGVVYSKKGAVLQCGVWVHDYPQLIIRTYTYSHSQSYSLLLHHHKAN